MANSFEPVSFGETGENRGDGLDTDFPHELFCYLSFVRVVNPI